MDTLRIDGSMGEGGGQILRTATALAAITGKATEITHIRARRSKPGLQAQHLTAVRAAGAICEAELHGAALGSSFLRFVPTAPVRPGAYDFDVGEARSGGSAGATGLVLQTVLLPLTLVSAQASSTVTVRGGTHVPMAPSADYLERVFLAALTEMGAGVRLSGTRAGFFPKGGGEVSMTVTAPPSVPLDRSERGKLKRLTAVVTTSELPKTVAERGVAQLRKDLSDYGVPIVPEIRDLPSSGAGASVVLVAGCERTTEGWQSLGERGKPMEQVVSEASRAFKRWYATGCGTDEHLADQLALPAVLTAGVSRWTTARVTEHLRTVLTVIGRYLPVEILLEEREDGSGVVTITR
ncbi:MAG: RNA 3'-terminal phosphate cyclase [Capsulimonadales bacterium]|nr:RNA 3'-terminal phosphate cyclase [Capsulimonadales bacterium]